MFAGKVCATCANFRTTMPFHCSLDNSMHWHNDTCGRWSPQLYFYGDNTQQSTYRSRSYISNSSAIPQHDPRSPQCKK
jgi:hypothetical protein